METDEDLVSTGEYSLVEDALFKYWALQLVSLGATSSLVLALTGISSHQVARIRQELNLCKDGKSLPKRAPTVANHFLKFTKRRAEAGCFVYIYERMHANIDVQNKSVGACKSLVSAYGTYMVNASDEKPLTINECAALIHFLNAGTISKAVCDCGAMYVCGSAQHTRTCEYCREFGSLDISDSFLKLGSPPPRP